MYKPSKKRTTLRAAAATLALVVLPTAAWAVGVSSFHGNGIQQRTQTYSNGAAVSGTLRSVQGFPVYYEGKVNYSAFGCSNTAVGRYTGNITSTSVRDIGGTIAATPSIYCNSTSVNSRVSRDIALSPDPSGAWSANY